MHVFKYTPSASPTLLEQGQHIPKPTSITWTERYLDPGEFEIVAPLSSGLREFLPEGTIISHTDTMEIMVVENHEINEEGKEDPILKITGRSFETFLDNRIVGTDQVRSSSTITPYLLASTKSWAQAVAMINSHIVTPAAAGDGLDYVVAEHICTGTAVEEEREINRGGLHARALEILEVDDLGIRTIRRNPFTGFGGHPTNTIIQIHQGVNRKDAVVFSWKGGDLESGEYLFSSKKLKNSAMVVGQYVYKMVDLGPTKYDRRTMIVEADDIDGYLDTVPTGGTLTAILNRMVTRGKQALKAQKRIQITRTDVSNMTKYEYRKDYNVGDLVTLDGNFDQIQTMRVVEFVEIEDEDGSSGHPTLAIPGE